MTKQYYEGKAAYSIDEAVVQSGVKRVKLYAEIKAGRLTARKCGSRTLILATDLHQWLNSLPLLSTDTCGGE
tara:strand:+ start:369 stop:584 length:216 start_codon:yes stop_codon:yes gene_type:complete